MQRRTQRTSKHGKIIAYKLDPGVFVVEIPETGQKISLGQPPDVVKRFQQVGYLGSNGISSFVVVDSKMQGDSISWVLTEFPVLYALYYMQVEKNGATMPAFYAGVKPMVIGLENDVKKNLALIKYGNYGMDEIGELDLMDIPKKTRAALRKEILGLAVGHKILDSHAFIDPVYLEPNPNNFRDFSDIGDGIKMGRIGYNTYRFLFKKDELDVDVTLQPDETFRSPVEFKHFRFPVMNFGIWHTGEYDGMDPYNSCAHTSIIHNYRPILIDYPSNMTNIINNNGLSKHSINTVIVTHNHDDHIGAVVELFRRSQRCNIITTTPVKYSLIKKLAVLVDLPEDVVENNFTWTILPFRDDHPYQTETLNMGGLAITGHLSCHSVPTTVYTIQINHDGYEYSYGHFLDIVAFKRMKKLVQENWMPAGHLSHLTHIIQKTKYSLIKYDAGCINDEALEYTVHGQWQDLKKAATDRSHRVFTHTTKEFLDPAYEQEGRFVRIGDLDSSLRDSAGKLIRIGSGNSAVIAFFSQAYQAVLAYFESLVDVPSESSIGSLMRYYASAFAHCPKQPDPNIGAFLLEQGIASSEVIVIIRGRAEIIQSNSQGEVVFRSSVGDGEVLGDVGVLTGSPRIAAIKSLNRLAYLLVPANLFIEAMNAIGVTYQGNFKEMFDRRLFFQSAPNISQDVSTIVLNRIAKVCRSIQVQKGESLINEGEEEDQLMVVSSDVEISVGSKIERIIGPDVVGECEFFLGDPPVPRLHSVKACQAMKILKLHSAAVRDNPVIMDNIRRIIRSRRKTIYSELPQVDPSKSS